MSLPETVTTLEKDGKTYYIIGTAHVSAKSVEDVENVIREVKPDTVCVELCQTRYDSMVDEDKWKKMNIIQVIKQGKALLLLANLALSAFQQKMGQEIGVKPGAELLQGVKSAEEVQAELVLADRDIQTTLKRTWANLGFFRRMWAMAGLMEAVIGGEKISEEELEELKEKDHLNDMLAQLAKEIPEIKEPLIDERDQFLISKIREAPGEKIVAVVGAGHVPGMVETFEKPVDRERISQLPPPSKVTAVLKYLIPAIVMALFAVGFYKHQGEDFSSMLNAWILPNAVLAGLFTIIAGAKPLTVIATALGAPITSLNPSISAGMVAGLVEGWLRKPSVEECERIPEDIKSLRGFYRNGFTRVLLVFAMGTLGSALGSGIGLTWLIKIFST